MKNKYFFVVLILFGFWACQNTNQPMEINPSPISNPSRQAPKNSDFHPDDFSPYQEFQMVEKQERLLLCRQNLLNFPQWAKSKPPQAQNILDSLENSFQTAFGSIAASQDSQIFVQNMQAFFQTIAQQLPNIKIAAAEFNPKMDKYKNNLMAVAQQLPTGDFGKFYAQNFLLDAYLTLLYHLSATHEIELAYDRFEILNFSTQHSPIVGKPFSLDLAVGAISEAKYSVLINEQTLQGDKFVRYSFTPKVRGTQDFEAKLYIKNPLTGETVTVSKTYTYTVAPK